MLVWQVSSRLVYTASVADRPPECRGSCSRKTCASRVPSSPTALEALTAATVRLWPRTHLLDPDERFAAPVHERNGFQGLGAQDVDSLAAEGTMQAALVAMAVLPP